jgi:hypothetical protein
VAPREEPCSQLEMEDFWRANIPSPTTSTHYVCAPLPPGAPGVTAEPVGTAADAPPVAATTAVCPRTSAMNKKMFKGCPVFGGSFLRPAGRRVDDPLRAVGSAYLRL